MHRGKDCATRRYFNYLVFTIRPNKLCLILFDHVYVFLFISEPLKHIRNGSCSDIGCYEMSLVECQNYGKENNIPWIVSGTWDPNADDGQPAPDHCYIRDSDKPAKGMFFNYRTTPQTATERRNKVCSCNGKDVLPYLNSVKSE